MPLPSGQVAGEKIDMYANLFLRLLLYAERTEERGPLEIPRFRGVAPIVVYRQVGLCVDAGYLTADKPGSSFGNRTYTEIRGLTNKGREVLSRYRQEYGQQVRAY